MMMLISIQHRTVSASDPRGLTDCMNKHSSLYNGHASRGIFVSSNLKGREREKYRIAFFLYKNKKKRDSTSTNDRRFIYSAAAAIVSAG